MKFTPQRIARLALMVAVVAVTASIEVPLGPVPFTLQTFFIAFTGALLGPLDGFIAMIVYLLLGAVGVPVFAGMSSGVAKFVGPTGGYLFSYPFFCALCGCFNKKEDKLALHILMAILGVLLCELMGTIQLKFVNGLEWGVAFVYGFGWFVIKDLICGVIAVILARQIRPRLKALH